jgi:D-3-phosphoglycerate dehydrogenase/glyoxylate/hydroxypyruvate reductase A
MSILVLPTSPFVEAQLAALRQLAADETIVTDADVADSDDVEVILAFKMAPGVVKRYARLRFIACAGAGVDLLLAAGDLPADVPITRPHDALQAARMAQYVALAVLRWHRELPRYEAQQSALRWERHDAQAEEQWTVGMMGFGELGRTVAAGLAALQYPVRAWTRTPHPEPGVEMFSGLDELPMFLADTRVLVCLLPLTDATRGLLAAPLFEKLPAGAYVINVSRGPILNEADLIAALDAGHLAGAALDVHAHEPLLPESPVWRHDRILVTPHIAAMPRPEAAARQVLDNLRRARRGEPLHHLIDRDRGY